MMKISGMVQPLKEKLLNNLIFKILALILCYSFLFLGLIITIYPTFLLYAGSFYFFHFVPIFYIGCIILLFVYHLINRILVSKFVGQRIVLIFEAMSVLWIFVCFGTCLVRLLLILLFAGAFGFWIIL